MKVVHLNSKRPTMNDTTNQAIRSLDQVDLLISQLLKDAKRDDDATNFDMPLEDVIVLLEISQDACQKSLNLLSRE